MNTTLLNRFRSQNPGWDQFPNLGSETLQNWIRDIESERGWEQDQALVATRNKLEEVLWQRAAKDAEAERVAILYPDHCGRPPKYASEDERREATRAQNRARSAKFRALHAGKPMPSLPSDLWQRFVSACSDRGLNPISEFTRLCLDEPSNVDFGVPEPATKEPSNVEF